MSGRLRDAGRIAAFVALLAPVPAFAQRIRLEIRPQVGDTIHMRLDQEIEMSGTSADAVDAPAKSMIGTTHVRTRAIPLRRLVAGSLVVAITDSIAMAPMSGTRVPATGRAVAGAKMTMIVRLDGAMEVIDTGEHDGETSPFFAPTPPMLPDGPVDVGGRWTRSLDLPIGPGPEGIARVRANFRLDSLGRNGDIAYITMNGTLSKIGASGRSGGSQRSTGTLSGRMQLDRRLGWITDTYLVLNVRTVITTGEAGSQPAQMQMKVTQRLRAMRGS